MTVKKTTALVPAAQFAALAEASGDMLATIRDNIGADKITDRDLDRVVLPLGGAVNWAVPTLDGEDSLKSLDGIIVHWTMPRAYWKQNLEDVGGQAPPDCSSTNGDFGVGNPGGDCFTCPLNQWESAERGKGKACKEKRLLFLLRADDLLPIVVQAPATSISGIRKYLLRLASNSLPYWAVITRLSLEKAQNGGGISYSRIVASSGGPIPQEQLAGVKAYVDSIKPLVTDTIVIPRQDED